MSPSTSNDTARPRGSRSTLWLIAAVCLFPFVASTVLYFGWQPAGRVNYGDLIEPRVLPDPPLPLLDGGEFRLSSLRGKWVMLHLDSGSCDDVCRAKLYKQRQVRLTQGKEMDRIERVWLIDDAGRPEPELLESYKGTWVVRAGGSGLQRQLPAQGAVRDHIYLIDPLGNLMLRFPRDADPNRMKKDLSRLLRASRIG